MKGKLKKFLIGSAVFVVVLTVWILVNSIDAPSYDDKGLLSAFKEVPDNENGYLDIAYFNDEDFYKKTGIDEDKMRDMVNRKSWNPKYIASVVNKNQKLISDIKKSNEKPHFKLPEEHGYFAPLVSYTHFVCVWRLLILKSKYETQHFKIDDALDTLELAVVSIQKLRSEQNHLLISYFVAVSVHAMVVDWAHELASNYSLDGVQYKKLIGILEKIDLYESDGFSAAFNAEFGSARDNVFEYRGIGFFERVKKGRESGKKIKEIFEQYNDDEYDLTLVGVYEVLRSMLPNYYTHANTTLNQLSPMYINMQNQAQGYCNKITLEWSDGVSWDVGPTWLDLIQPNSFGLRQKSTAKNQRSFFVRRCLYHIYIDSVKTAVAIHWFESKNHRLPNNLQELVPKYLTKLPTDYFNGEPLHYSLEDRWLYSVGTDDQDNGGNLQGKFRDASRCVFGRHSGMVNDVCETNPTVPIDWNDYQNMATEPTNQ